MMKMLLITFMVVGMLSACPGGGKVPLNRVDISDTNIEGEEFFVQPDAFFEQVQSEEVEKKDLVTEETSQEEKEDQGIAEHAQVDNVQIEILNCEKDDDCIGQVKDLKKCEEIKCQQGICQKKKKTDGSLCDDDDKCTENDTCIDGKCQGSPVICDDKNPCTDDYCDEKEGCIHENNFEDCDDGNPCTLNDMCIDGACYGGDVDPQCECETDDDCEDMDDEDLCNGKLVCKDSKCVLDPSSVVKCDTSGDNQCKQTKCIPDTGECETIEFDGELCDDNNICTVGDICIGGECISEETLDCNDNNPCTDDECNFALGCINVPNNADCDDGNICTKGDKCENGLCIPGVVDETVCPESQCAPDKVLYCDTYHKHNNGGENSTNKIINYSCNQWDYEGPEYTYKFVAPYNGKFTVILANEDAETDILVLDGSEGKCISEKCIAWGLSDVTFEGNEYHPYYFVVDGWEGSVGDYIIMVTCTPNQEVLCMDKVDNDKDGDVDCDDDDCYGTEICPIPECTPYKDISCGQTYKKENTAGLDATNMIRKYPCSPDILSGPELTYRFVAEKDQKVVVKLENEKADTRLVVIKDDGTGTCSPINCVDYGKKQSTINVMKGEIYYYLVDGYQDAKGTFDLKVECQ